MTENTDEQGVNSAYMSDGRFEDLLKEKTNLLQSALNKGHLGEAMRLVQDIQQVRDQNLYQEVGRLTRGLHEAIKNFNVDVTGSSEDSAKLSEMAEATDRLDYVVTMTERAANKTMDLVEETFPLVDNLKSSAAQLHADWNRLAAREMDANEFRELYKRMGHFLDEVEGAGQGMSGKLNEILLAQDYQDLTGQVIQRVTGLVRDLESSLVRLVQVAGAVDSITGMVHDTTPDEVSAFEGVGPQIDTTKEDVVANQDDVDELLSSLGF